MRKITLVLASVLLLLTSLLQAQTAKPFDQEQNTVKKAPKPGIAFVRSLLVPGLGHAYLGADHKRRTRFHLGTELLLWVSYVAVDQRVGRMQDRMFGYAAANAGTQLANRSRAFQLAVANYNSLDEYNDFMERSRNWSRILPDTPENQWYWSSTEERQRYVELRSSRDQADQQLPGIVSIMVLNRVFSALNAYSAARKWEFVPSLSAQMLPDQAVSPGSGMLLNARFDF